MAIIVPKVGMNLRVTVESRVSSVTPTYITLNNGTNVQWPPPLGVAVDRIPEPEPAWGPGDIASDSSNRTIVRTTKPARPWFWADAPDGAVQNLTDTDVNRPLLPLRVGGVIVSANLG